MPCSLLLAAREAQCLQSASLPVRKKMLTRRLYGWVTVGVPEGSLAHLHYF